MTYRILQKILGKKSKQKIENRNKKIIELKRT